MALAAFALFHGLMGQPAPPHYRASFGGAFAKFGPGITGAPFAIEQVAEVMVADWAGRRFPHGGHEWVFRDSLGRTRIERPMTSPDRGPDARLVQVVDPIAGYQYVVDVVNRVAHRIKVPLTTSQSDTDAGLLLRWIEKASLSSFHRNVLIIENLSKTPPKVTSQDPRPPGCARVRL